MRQPTQLTMTRPHLGGIMKLSIPRGYSLRTYEPGDDAHWARIISSAFKTECTATVFWREIADREPFLPERVFFLTYQGKPIGTATAWVKPQFGAAAGYVHMVAVVPEHTRKGLGKVLTTAVLGYFKKEGRRSAFLHTEGHRFPAIKTYLELGFEPVVTDEEVRRVWLDVLRALRKPALAHKYCGQE